MTHQQEDDDDGWFGLLWAAWWTRIVLGAALIGAGAYIHSVLAARESQGGTIRMPAIFIAIYEAIGKTGILGVFVLLGGACIASALYTRLRR